MPDGDRWLDLEEETFLKLKKVGIVRVFEDGEVQKTIVPGQPFFAFECFDPVKRQHWKKRYRNALNLESMQEVPINGPGIALALARKSPIPNANFEWEHVCRRIEQTQDIFKMEVKTGILMGHVVCKAARHYGISLEQAVDLQLESKLRLQERFEMKIVMGFHSSYPDCDSCHPCLEKNRGREKTYHLSGQALKQYRQVTTTT